MLCRKTLRHEIPHEVKSHNFAIFCFFGGTRKIVYAKVHWIFQNPPRKPQSHQNSDFLGLGDPKRYFCTFGEKEQTSKRVSVIACDNVISKARFATRTRLRKNPSRTPKIHQNSDFLGNDIIYQNSDFLGEHQKTINPAFYGGIYLCHCEASTGVPAGYCVPVGKRNKQAKDKQLSLATIVWSKVKFMTRNVP